MRRLMVVPESAEDDTYSRVDVESQTAWQGTLRALTWWLRVQPQASLDLLLCVLLYWNPLPGRSA